MNSRSRSYRIDLGIAIAHARLSRRGVRWSHSEIATFCDCTWAAIWTIEQRALQKLKRAAHLRNDPVLREMCADLRG